MKKSILSKTQLRKWTTKPSTAAGIARAKKKWKTIEKEQKKYQANLNILRKKIKERRMSPQQAYKESVKLTKSWKTRARKIVG